MATVKDDGREIDVSYSASWAFNTTLIGTVLYPPAAFFRFPLHVGDTYPCTYEFHDALKGQNQGKVEWRVSVAGWENVTVPAGAFHAIKIEGEGVVTRYDRIMTFPVKIGFWYAPAVNRWVKQVFTLPQQEIVEELVGYRLTH